MGALGIIVLLVYNNYLGSKNLKIYYKKLNYF
jgi:hypothetical protein